MRVYKLLRKAVWIGFIIVSFPVSATSLMEPLLLSIEINHVALSDITECYKDQKAQIWVSQEDLKKWGLLLPSHMPVLYQHRKLYLLNRYPGIHYQLDIHAMKLSIQMPPVFFPTRVFSDNTFQNSALRPTTPGMFLNYDATAFRNSILSATRGSVLSELGFFDRFGVGTQSMLVSNNANNINNFNNTSHASVTRLETTFTLDQPEHVASWRVGDAITGASDWSNAARFGGIQYATNFNTQPNLITFPLPAYHGEAIIPSTVNVFVNNVLNQKKIIDSGPYVINNIPVITGAGNINVVTQDILGRNQVVSLPYYASNTLLKPGLKDFSYETGFIRNDYGITSNDYSHFLATGTYQRGITDNLTAGSHAEFLSHQQTAGVSTNYIWHQYGVISLAMAGSHSTFGQGYLSSAGFSRQASPFNYGFKTTFMSKKFLQLGIADDVPAQSISHQIFTGYTTDHEGSVGLSYTDLHSREILPIFSETFSAVRDIHTELLTATYSRELFHHVSFMCGGIADLRHSQPAQLFASFSLIFDNIHTLNSYVSYQNHQTQPSVIYGKNLTLENGYGYHVFSAHNTSSPWGGDVELQNNTGNYTARVYETRPNQLNYELDASGSVGYLGGDMFLSRKITNSFALVQIPHYRDIEVYYQHQPIGRTNKHGDVLIPVLLPYQENTIAIEPKDLPLDTSLSVTQKEVIPYFRSGMLVKFPVQKIQAVTAHLIQSNGSVVPAGAEVILGGERAGAIYPVGYEGEIYLENVESEGNTEKHFIQGEATWEQQSCHFSFNIPRQKSTLYRIGKVKCS